MNHSYKLYLVTDRASLKNISLGDVVASAAKAGVSCVQLRDKHACTRELIECAKNLKMILNPYDIPLFINDRVDVALAANADGVHLGNSDMHYLDAREMIGNRKLIGLTINNIDQLNEYNQYQLAYLGVSSLFLSKVKHDIEHLWSEAEIAELKKKSKHRLIGIGGISEKNLSTVLNYSLDGIAVASAICAQPSTDAVFHQTLKFIKRIESK